MARLREHGRTVVLSDGDVVFQPLKVERSGIGQAVGGEVLIYVHKEQELDDVQQRYPAERYVAVDDKLWLLDAMKRYWGPRVTTVWPRQGHYVTDERVQTLPPADVTIGRIGELLAWTLDGLLQAGRA